jgi:hypothetical protein
MKKPKSLQKPINPDYISGIYNYCDRWCERCDFTSRCMNFEMSEEYIKDIENDPNNDKLWKNMGKIYNETIEMLKYIAYEKGIDLDNIEIDPDYQEREKNIRENAKNHALYKATKKYSGIAHEWVKKESDLIKNKEKELNDNLKLGINEKETLNSCDEIVDSIEIINWYCFFISAKIYRALSSDDDFYDDMDMSEFPKGSDGSAKIALIAIDRSIAAWGYLQKHFSESFDEILDILVLLERIRKKTEKCFPNARAFVRPGFDTGESPKILCLNINLNL